MNFILQLISLLVQRCPLLENVTGGRNNPKWVEPLLDSLGITFKTHGC